MGFERSLGFLSVFSISVGAMIGVAGIFFFGAIWYFLYARNRIDRTGALAQTQRRIEFLQENAEAAHGGDGRKNTAIGNGIAD